MAWREAARIGAYLYLEPFFTVLVAMIILAEPLSLGIFVGGGLILHFPRIILRAMKSITTPNTFLKVKSDIMVVR